MSINKEKWAEIAKKYPSKASWVKALQELDYAEENEDLFSALIELDPSDLVNHNKIGSTGVKVNWDSPYGNIQKIINTTTPEPAQNRLDAVEKELAEARDLIAEAQVTADAALMEIQSLDVSKIKESPDIHISYPAVDSKEILDIVNRELGRVRDTAAENKRRADLAKKGTRVFGGSSEDAPRY